MNNQKMKLTKLLDDPYLTPFKGKILQRRKLAEDTQKRLTNDKMGIADFANGHEYFGLHKLQDSWALREWAPNATDIYLIGEFNNWKDDKKFSFKKIDQHAGVWEIKLPLDTLKHKDIYKLHIHWNGGSGERIPAYARRVIQDDDTKVFSAQVWDPKDYYVWKVPTFTPEFTSPLIYESHIGMGQEKEAVGTYDEFRNIVLPQIVEAGYNTLQIMALMEHPYYGSFGYHVSSFFAASSRFGTPEDLKALIDEAHSNGIAVIMDLVHSHAVKNETEGLGLQDGTPYLYFHDGDRGIHSAWDSRCFNYGKTEVLHFLLSNCRFWLDEYKIDGYRFDGVTSMLYYDHGLGTEFAGYDHYYDNSVDEDALVYMTLANKVIHATNPHAISIAEDVSGMPGLGAPYSNYGIGFDYRLALGIPDYWFNLVKKTSDDDWHMDGMYYELTNHRKDERTISYVECHDQAIVGSKTMAFELMNESMYYHMQASDDDMKVARGMALHKMMRLITAATAGGGYLNFMGNEFGHPEWIDFPREGNDWSYSYARRQWNLKYDQNLKYRFLSNFDKSMLHLISQYNIIEHSAKMSHSHNENKMLAFKRGSLVFIFNFHPTLSEKDYFIDMPEGSYKTILCSDDKDYGGQDRINKAQIFNSRTETSKIIRDKVNKTERDKKLKIEKEQILVTKTGFRIYIPCRSVIVLKEL